MYEWLDGLSLWWYAVAQCLFLLLCGWLMKWKHAPIMEEDEPERRDH